MGIVALVGMVGSVVLTGGNGEREVEANVFGTVDVELG